MIYLRFCILHIVLYFLSIQLKIMTFISIKKSTDSNFIVFQHLNV